MEVTDWITLAAVVVALGLGVASIIQTQKLQKKERKGRLLNEIIQWATKSAESAIYRQQKNKHELWKTELNYKNCRAKSEYIKGIAISSFSTLNSQIDCVVTKLDEAIEGTTKFRENESDDGHKLMRTSEEGLTNAVIRPEI